MKRLITLVLLIVLIAAGLYAYKLYTGKVKSLDEVKADQTVTATDLIAAFEKDSASANKQYLGKILAVKGTIKSVEQESATVVLGGGSSTASVRCSLDTGYTKTITALNAGRPVTIKGACTGYNADELGLGADVVLNRCVIEENKP